MAALLFEIRRVSSDCSASSRSPSASAAGRSPSPREPLPPGRRAVGSGFFSAALITIGAGGDNLAVYIRCCGPPVWPEPSRHSSSSPWVKRSSPSSCSSRAAPAHASRADGIAHYGAPVLYCAIGSWCSPKRARSAYCDDPSDHARGSEAPRREPRHPEGSGCDFWTTTQHVPCACGSSSRCTAMTGHVVVQLHHRVRGRSVHLVRPEVPHGRQAPGKF